MNKTYPKTEWEVADPEDAGIDAGRLMQAKAVLDEKLGDAKYRVAVVCAGRLTVEWAQGIDCAEKVNGLAFVRAQRGIFEPGCLRSKRDRDDVITIEKLIHELDFDEASLLDVLPDLPAPIE